MLAEMSTSNAEQWIKTLSAVVGALGVLLAAITYYRTGRWKRAEVAIQLLTDMLKDPQTRNALAMLDWQSRCIDFGVRGVEAGENGVAFVDQATLRRALAIGPDTPGGRAEFGFPMWAIRDTFDAFLNRLGLVAMALEKGLLRESEIAHTLGYWIERMTTRRDGNWDAATAQQLTDFIGAYYTDMGVPQLLRRIQAGGYGLR